MTTTDQSFSLGEGRNGVLLIHGLGGTPTELKLVAKGLARNGFKVYCCQLAGHCGTPEDLTATTWEDWYASVETAFDKLRAECDTMVVGGLSMGAVLALHLAAQPSSSPWKWHAKSCARAAVIRWSQAPARRASEAAR